MIELQHLIPRTDILLGIVRAEKISMSAYQPDFGERLYALAALRREPLSETDEHRRASARDMLRNGRYKPTGRGKPASEYLLRSVAEGGLDAFPRINAPVDACNYISLKYLLPISLWDVDLAGTDRYVFRLGISGESYVFNQGGQAIDVADLIVGCRIGEEAGPAEPIVNPVKDSMVTKTTPDTRHVAACMYVPLEAFSGAEAVSICEEFAGLLASRAETECACSVANPGETISV